MPILPDIGAGDGRVSAGRPDQTAKHPHRRRFAGAVRAQKTEDRPRLDGEREIVDRAKIAIHLAKAIEENNRFCHVDR